MKRMRDTTEKVEKILERCRSARNSDKALYLELIREIKPEVLSMTVENFLVKFNTLNIPSIETVGRCRRKVAERRSDLIGNADVQARREINEEEFRSYAREM